MTEGWQLGAGEFARQASVEAYGLAGAKSWETVDPELTRLAILAQRLLSVDCCAIDILDDRWLWSIAGTTGAPVSVSARADSLCDRILSAPGAAHRTFLTTDASLNPLVSDSAWVNGDAASIRFYAAAPLVGREGLPLGTVCMWSAAALTPSTQQLTQLADIRDAVMSVLDSRRPERIVSLVEEPCALPAPLPTIAAVPDRGAVASKHDAWTIDAVIDERALRTVFQPVVHLATGTITGFEALSRGPAGTSLESPVALLEAAKKAGRLGELDWMCRVQAMQAAVEAGLHPSLSWLINVEPAGLAIECPAHLLAGLGRARIELRAILEVVERDVEGYVAELLHATDQARRDSWGVALDDVGAEESSLALLPFLRPDVVKLDMALVRSVPKRDAAAITAAVRAYAERTGAVILAEGIETEAHERLACVFGATYGQGYRYGRPGPLPAAVSPPRHVIPLRQHLDPLDGQTPFEVLAARLEPHRGSKEHLLHISQHLEEQNAIGGRASVLLANFQDAKFFSPAKRARYEALSRSNALTVVLAEHLDIVNEPRFHVGPLRAGSRLGTEWVVIVVNPHYAAAFVARDCGDHGPDRLRRFDFIVTHDRDAVIAAARSHLQELILAPRHLDVLAQAIGTDYPGAGADNSPAQTPASHFGRSTAPARKGWRSW